MTTRRMFFRNAAATGAALGLVFAAGLSLPGCGGSMGSSAYDLALVGIESSPGLTVNTPTSVTVTYTSTVPNINEQFFSDPPSALGTYNAVWSVVRTDPAGLNVTFPNNVGSTTTAVDVSPSPHVRLSGQSTNSFQVSGAGADALRSVTLRVRVNLQLADGSHKSQNLDVTLNAPSAQ